MGLKERAHEIGRNSNGGKRTGKKLKGQNEGRRMGLIIYFVKILKQYKKFKNKQKLIQKNQVLP